MTPRDTRRAAMRTLLACELRMLLRDRRTILISVIAPLVVFPLVIFGMRAAERSRETDLAAGEIAWAAAGGDVDGTRALIEGALAAAAPEDRAAAPRRFREVAGDADALLAGGEVQLVAALEYTDTAPLLRLSYRGDRERSRDAVVALSDVIDALRAERRAAGLHAAGLADAHDIASVDAHDVASAERRGRALLGMFVTPFFVLLLLSGGAVFAADAIAGEKERGTLETLLTTAAARRDIVRAKQLAILTVGIAIAVVNVANLLLYAGIGLIELPAGFALRLPPLTAALVLLLFLPVAALVAAVLLALSGYVRSYREYQVFFLPVFLLFLVPAAACVLPGVRLRSAIAAVPVAGISVAVREVLAGTVDLPFLALAFLSTGAAALFASRATDRALSAERLIAPAADDEAGLPGPVRFRRHLLRNFALLWTALFVGSLWAGDRLDIRAQVALNLIVLFLGASLLMLRHYRLDARDALSLRWPHPAAWLAVIIGAPAGFITGIGLGRLTAHVLPVPERVLDAFAQYLLPPDMPLWQVLLFLALLPGVCEEIAFRGLLLHGLRDRLRPALLVLAVGAIFGAFHVDLFRLFPTAYLGALLAAVVVLSGSLYPAIAWHALNNAAGLVAASRGVRAETLPVWMYGLGVIGLAVAFGLLEVGRRSARGTARTD